MMALHHLMEYLEEHPASSWITTRVQRMLLDSMDTSMWIGELLVATADHW